MQSQTLDTPHGRILLSDSGPDPTKPLTLLLIHGNSSNSKIFAPIISNPTFSSRYRLLTFDLPGHGASSDAPDPEKSYSMRGYADLAVEILEHLKITRVAVLGWSLGGHSGIEMIPLLTSSSSNPSTATSIKFIGLMIVGTPPALGKEQVGKGFLAQDAHMGLAAQEHFSEEEIYAFSHETAGGPFDPWMQETVKRTDGRARKLMFGKFAGGVGVGQVRVVEEQEGVELAVVNGGAEPFVNLDYLDAIKWKRLWTGKCVRLEGLGHAPFWEDPKVFAPVLESFMKDCEGL